MSNYQQTHVDGDTWLRANKIIFDNPYAGKKRVRFVEEKAYVLDDEIITKPKDILDVDILSEEDMEREVEIIDPETGESTGEKITYKQLYAILFSAYIEKAQLRDAPPETEEDEEVEDDEPVEDDTDQEEGA